MVINVEKEIADLKRRVAELEGSFGYITGRPSPTLTRVKRGGFHCSLVVIRTRLFPEKSASIGSSPMLVLCARIFPALLRKQCVAFYGQAKQNPPPIFPAGYCANWGFEFSGPAFGSPRLF